jgi:hypothetical protein
VSSKKEDFRGIVISGFLGGVFARVGVDPETAILSVLVVIDPSYAPAVFLISFVLTILPFMQAYFKASYTGLVFLIASWIAGYLTMVGEPLTSIGIFLFIILIILAAII